MLTGLEVVFLGILSVSTGIVIIFTLKYQARQDLVFAGLVVVSIVALAAIGDLLPGAAGPLLAFIAGQVFERKVNGK